MGEPVQFVTSANDTDPHSSCSPAAGDGVRFTSLLQPAGSPSDEPPGRPATTVVYEDDRMIVAHVHFRPGDESPSFARPTRISLALKGGTLTKVFPDGRKEAMTYETHQVRVNDPAPEFAPRNESAEDVILYVVSLKAAN